MHKFLDNRDSRKEWILFLLSISSVVILVILGIFIGMLINYNRIINAELLARSQAHFDSILLTRRWNASHGGVFVEKKEGMVSNPYLANPDITTIDGKVYTKKNPALMTREISEIAEVDGISQFHITSMNPLNPANTPDLFETDALTAFAEGTKEKYITEIDSNDTFFRYMAPLITEKSCLNCHGIQGYKEGDIRGGISVRFKITDVKESIKQNNFIVISLFIIIALLLVVLMYYFVSKLSKKLKNANEIILIEKNKSEKLLLNVLPVRVASELKNSGKTEPELFDNVSVFFSDIVDFTDQSSKINPTLLISELNKMFTAFDVIMEKNNCERIKTIGDAYLAVCGMPIPDEKHALNIVNSAMEIKNYLLNLDDNEFNWKIRIGVHSGSVVGGVVGIKKYIYDVFGDTINTASRMESNSEPMQINISESTYRLVKDEYDFTERDSIEVKGKGIMKMYFVKNANKYNPITYNSRSSARVSINTDVQIDIGAESYQCEAIEISVDGGALLRVKDKSIDKIKEDIIGEKIYIAIGSNKNEKIEGKIIRYFNKENELYFGIEY